MKKIALTLAVALVATLGAGNATVNRPRGCTGKGRMQSMREAYERYREGGRLPATYEVVYGHAWSLQTGNAAAEVQLPLPHRGITDTLPGND